MKNTFKKLLTGFLAICAVILCAAALTAPRSVPAAGTEAADMPEDNGYLLRDWQGYIAVFEGRGDTPTSLTDIETATLNDFDREKLRSGIPARDRTELLSLLEDLGS